MEPLTERISITFGAGRLGASGIGPIKSITDSILDEGGISFVDVAAASAAFEMTGGTTGLVLACLTMMIDGTICCECQHS